MKKKEIYEAEIITRAPRKAKNKTNLKQILKELRGHYGKLSEVIMELIDNASSVLEKFAQTNGLIEVIIEKRVQVVNKVARDVLCVIVRDNGMGIQDIDAALTLGKRTIAMTALSGHGMGFKNLPVLAITLRSVNQHGDAWEVEGPFVENVQVSPFSGFTDRATGTEVEFIIDANYLDADVARWGERSAASNNRAFMTMCECVAEHIGVVMGLRMKNFQQKITITAKEGAKEKVFDVEPLLLNINPMLLVADHPELGYTKGSKQVPAFNGDGNINVEYAFGYGTPSRKSKRGYFQNNQVSQGWYISINGRYIGKTASISANKTHPSLNGLMGWIDLQVNYAEQAPQTEIAKTGFVEASSQYTALLEMIQGLIPNLPEVITREVKCANLHDIMRDELYESLLTSERVAGKEVQVPGESKQKIDVMDYTNGVLFELKTKGATTKDVYQVYGYVAAYLHNTPMNRPFNTVFLCATDFPEECQAALQDANFMLEMFGVEICPKYLHEVEGIKTLPSAKK